MSLSLSPARISPHACAQPKQSRLSFALMIKVWGERRALARLDESRLEDLGLSSAKAAQETARPIWDLPNHRL